MFIRNFRPQVAMTVVMTAILGVGYPLATTMIAHLAFPRQSDGSLVERNGRIVGSSLIGQNFSDPKYFWGRPSATTPQPYNALASTGSNLGPLNPALVDAIRANVVALRWADPTHHAPVPVDLVEASASGLDPDISLAAARYQVTRIAIARQRSPREIDELVTTHRRERLLGFIGEVRVNVLELNLALDSQF